MGEIFVTPSITAGTGMLCAKPNPAYADLVVAQDVIIEGEILEKSKNYFGCIMEALVPRVRQSTAFCKMTTI